MAAKPVPVKKKAPEAKEQVATPPVNPRGVALKENDIQQRKVLSTAWRARAEYGWDAGIAISRYLAELKNGRLVARKCNVCRRVMVPPRMFCEWCFRPTDEWVVLENTGRVNTYSICYVAWDATRIETPQIPAVIEIDGASPGMGILHLLGETKPDDVHIGMRVEAVWRPAAERQGAITDILYFKPLGRKA